jgi:hypothetical protein
MLGAPEILSQSCGEEEKSLALGKNRILFLCQLSRQTIAIPTEPDMTHSVTLLNFI